MSNHQILNASDHGDLRIRTEASASLGDAVMATLAVPDEFRRLQAHYPIVFHRDIETGRFTALALFGFENGENLFLVEDRWEARYRPLSMAIAPFLIGQPEGGGQGQVHVDMDHPRISTDDTGTAVFDDEGRPTSYLENISEKLGALHAGYQSSAGFLAALERLDLLEPFTFELPLSTGSKQSLVGFHTIAEERLRALDGETLADLQNAGHLMPIFMAMASLSNLAVLAERKDAKESRG